VVAAGYQHPRRPVQPKETPVSARALDRLAKGI
jgi:hypothetical protein